MTTLDARYIRHPRALYYCDHCARPLGSHTRIYGMADREPPWTLRLHVGCCPNLSDDPKIARALTLAAGKEVNQ